MTKFSFLLRIRVLCVLFLLTGYAGISSAQPLDDVSLAFQSNGVVATIQMTGPVQYLRHLPASHGKTLEIYYERVQDPINTQKPELDAANKNAVPEPAGNINVVQDKTRFETWVDNEVRKSPPSGLIPSFTVTTRDQKTQPKLVIEFSREAEYSVEAGKDKRSFLITIRPEKRAVSTGPLPFLPVVKVLPAVPANPTPEAVATADYNKQARELMAQGREALSTKKNAEAVDIFNKLLLLPPNDYSQDGQEWIGVARERSQQADKARIEYELYLRLYPEGEGSAQVAQRLAGLSGHDADQGIVDAAEKKKEARIIKFGSVSSRYYYGKSTSVTSTQNFNGAPETLTTSMTDQSMLISTIDASERYLSEEFDGRLVFRDVNTRNFLSNKASVNRVSAAYGDFKSRKNDYQLRVGRQSAYGGGVQGRFDGIYGAYGQAQLLRVNAVAGTLADYSQGSKPQFVGLSVDKDAFSFYGINQTVDGVLDRRAVGTEWRYFEDKRYAFVTVDYDINFKALNSAQVMGNTAVESLSFLPSGSRINFMIDHRRAPTLSIRNALNGAATNSVSTLLQTMSLSEVRDLALKRTSTSNMVQIGLSFPFKEKWQASGDVRLSNVTGLGFSGLATGTNGQQAIDPNTGLQTCAGTQTAQGCLAQQSGRGTEMGLTGTITGSGIIKVGDVWSGSLSFNTSSAAKGQSIFMYNHSVLKRDWGVDTSLQLYSQTDQFGGKISRASPMVRGSYQYGDQLSFDVDGGFERNTYTGNNQTTKTSRYFLSGGLRWDF